ncbi:hypothetical protein OIY81_774 [Cryptosporidium canis]|uniref:C2H2-type domain-containing protein n=1 Tax=Cryptosporidium canis TaxID=195482 RepID=A0ABQ8P7Q8_9CRYT|nr:hypothetical protein OJ252_1588 [Cryptosporidium canis]KAJ1613904.1 hypothetical protein OIY81_774 [Cryptosporidium canis]
MDVILSRIALEELSFLGRNDIQISELLEKVISRVLNSPYRNYVHLLKNVSFREKIISLLINHKQIIVKDKLGGTIYSYNKHSIPAHSDNLLVTSNDSIQNYILDLNIFSSISEVEGRLAVYMAIASKGFNGCWQYEISRILKMDPKMVFQHLKYLYKYDNIVRFSIPMPSNHKKRLFPSDDHNPSSGGHLSAIIWLTRFFDINLIPRELSQLIWYQHIQPLSTEIVRILEYKAPGKIAWEKDIRALCAGFLIVHDENSADHLICSQRTANKIFNKLRDFLLKKNIKRVFAWDPRTKSYSPCLCLNDAFPFTTIESSSEVTIKTEAQVSELDISNSDSNNQKNANSEDQPNLGANDGFFHDPSVEEIQFSTGNKIFEITEATQVMWLIRASGKAGLVSLDIVKIFGINMKRLGKLLSDLCKTKIIVKIPQRYNRTFMYRYYFNNISFNSSSDAKNPLIIENNGTDHNPTSLKLESTSTMTILDEVFPHKKVELSGYTEQFVKRLVITKKWLDESKILTIPEIAKLFSEYENTQNGPDRKTIKRILSKILELDDKLKESSIIPNKSTNTLSQSGEVAIFYSSRFYTEEEAINLKAIELKNKRSTTTKSAIERRKKELSQVAAIIDASQSMSPNKQKDRVACTDPINATDIESHQLNTKASCNSHIQAFSPRLVSNEVGNATVVINTQNFMVASLNIEISEESNHITDSPCLIRNDSVSKFDIPGTEFINKMNFDPSKRISLGFSNLSRGGIKIQSSEGEIGFLSFSQKILAHYGFVFPIMIRLKILHHHLLYSCCENEPTRDVFSTKEILDNMTIDTFLRIIGFGHRSRFIEDYLLYGDSEAFTYGPTTRIKELPHNLYEKLTRSNSKKNMFSTGKRKLSRNYDKGRKAITILYKLLLFLCKLNLLNFSKFGTENIGINDLNESSNTKTNIDVVPVSSPSWKLKYNSSIPILISTNSCCNEKFIEYIKHNDNIFDLRISEQFEQFWNILNKESIETHRFILENKSESYSVTFPDILLKRNWKINPLLPLCVRNKLEKYARKLLVNDKQSYDQSDLQNDKQHIVLSLASPEIKNISTELSLTPLTVLKYLLRVVDSLSLEEFNFSNSSDKINKISFHPIHDPRYQCHICHALYSTHPAIISHYKTIHNITSITNSSMYTISKSNALSSKNKNINLNSMIKTQILNENCIPNALKHLLETASDKECGKIERNDKIELLRSFLRLSKEDIILLYLILFINNKSRVTMDNIHISNGYLFRIILFCKERKCENNLFSLQFLRIKLLIQEMSKKPKYQPADIVEFIFSCLRSIYPLNSKLLENIKLKEKQRICWNHLLETNLFYNRWRVLAINKSNNLTNGRHEYYTNQNDQYSLNLFSQKIDYFIAISFIKSEIIGQKNTTKDQSSFIFSNLDSLCMEHIKNYLDTCVKKNIFKQINYCSDLSNFEDFSNNFSKRFSLTRRTLLYCFGKTMIWREIFNLCFAYLQINYSDSNKFNINTHNLSGAFVLNHLNNLIENDCLLDIEWSDPDFYEKESNKTDEELFRLLNEAVDRGDDFLDNSNETSLSNDKLIFDTQTSTKNSKFSKSYETFNSELVEACYEKNPIISNVLAIYKNKQDKVINFPNLREVEYSSIHIPFIGTLDSDPIELSKVPSIFSISGILLSFSKEENRHLKRQTSDPIFTIIKIISKYIIDSNSNEHHIIMKTIFIIIDSLKKYNLLTVKEFEYIFFSKFSELISKLSNIGSRLIDPGILFCEFKIPIIYHIIYLLEILKVCYRIPMDGNWAFSLFSSINSKLVKLRDENNYNITTDKCENYIIPINLPTRIWLIWSKEAVLQLFDLNELNLIIKNINKSLTDFEMYDFTIPIDIYINASTANCFVYTNGQINLTVCGLLIYYISSLIYKSPIFNLAEFTSRFSLFSCCEIELILESMFAESCLYKDNTKIIFSKPIQDIFKIYEGY